MPEAYLSATLAKNFRFIWFMSSLGVHSPCFWINVTTIFFSNFLTLSHRNVLNSSIQFPNWILNSRSLWEILNRKRITIRVYRLYIYGIVPDYVPCFCIERQISPKEYLTLKVIFLHESESKNLSIYKPILMWTKLPEKQRKLQFLKWDLEKRFNENIKKSGGK